MSGSSHTDVMLAGAVAAFTVDLLIYPLDTLKTRQQSQDFLQTFTSPTRKTKLPSAQLFKGLYQGIGIVVVATLPAAGTFFTVYEGSKGFFSKYGNDKKDQGGWLPQPAVHSLASATAECASCVVLTPAEVIKQNAQMLQRSSPKADGKGKQPLAPSASTSLQALRELGGRQAPGKLLSGYTALVARNLPFTALQFPVFEFFRERIWERRKGNREVNVKRDGARGLLETGIVTGVSAGAAGSMAALITTPMDVVKTRMMLSAGGSSPSSSTSSSSSTSHSTSQIDKASQPQRHVNQKQSAITITKDVIRERGVKGLFRGAALRSVWTAVGSGLYLGMYEVSRLWLSKGRTEDEGILS
ncbi:mitochondrial carrier domain-containing protein [Xylariaceae sp. FL1019]|nr:mitochondrial carrier domain-containing protein [Xylariaceae sp. FL1019]